MRRAGGSVERHHRDGSDEYEIHDQHDVRDESDGHRCAPWFRAAARAMGVPTVTK